MKKIFAMLLMLVMMTSIVACGKKQELEPGEGQEAIEITAENWHNYFELKDEIAVYEVEDKDGNKVVEAAYMDKFIYLKEEYKDKFVAADITFTYKLGRQEIKTLTYTIADGSYTLTDSAVTFSADKELEERDLPTIAVTDVKTQMYINAYADYENEEEEEIGFFESLALLFGGAEEEEKEKEVKTTYVCDTMLRPELEFTKAEGKIIVNK